MRIVITAEGFFDSGTARPWKWGKEKGRSYFAQNDQGVTG